MPSEDARRDPVEVIRHAREYLKNTRGVVRFNGSLAATILDEAEKGSAKCIDYLLSEKTRANGVYCCCDFHEQEFKRMLLLAPKSARKPDRRNGKAAAAGEDKKE